MDANKGSALQDADGGELDGKLDKDARAAKTPKDSNSFKAGSTKDDQACKDQRLPLDKKH